MDVNRIKETFDDVSNKKLSGGISVDTINRYMHLVNIDLFKLKFGLPEAYNPNNPQSFQVINKVSDDVDFLLVPDTDINKNAAGFFPKPSDYGAYDYMLYGYVENDCGNTKLVWKSVETVIGSERAIRLGSQLIPPTVEKPIVSWTNKGFRIDPESITQIRLNYARLPVAPHWDYDMSGDQEIFRPVGSAAGQSGSPSADAEWPETIFGDFVIRLCRYAGIELREEELVNYSQQRQISGQ